MSSRAYKYECAVAAYLGGFRGPHLAEAIAISQAEASSFGAEGPDSSDGKPIGAMQVKTLHLKDPRLVKAGITSVSDLKNPVKNMRAAYIISGGGTNWSQWGDSVKTGANSVNVSSDDKTAAKWATAHHEDKWLPGTHYGPDPIGAAGDAISAVTSPITGVANFLGNLGVIFKAEFWLQVAKIGAGVFGVWYGLSLIGKQYSLPIPTPGEAVQGVKDTATHAAVVAAL